MGLARSKVPVFTLAGGLFGLAFAQSLQWYQSVIGYPLITGGKPLNSTEAFVPITFETTILYAAFGAIAGMLLLNGLPRLYHPVFRGRTFARATNDGFFLTVEADDPKFDRRETRVVLEAAGRDEDRAAGSINEQLRVGRESDADALGFPGGVALLAAVVVSQMGRAERSATGVRSCFVTDMDVQPRYDAQAAGPFFPDGRAMRTPPAGTVPFGGADYDSDAGSPRQNPDFLQDDDGYYRGKQGQAWVDAEPPEARHGACSGAARSATTSIAPSATARPARVMGS